MPTYTQANRYVQVTTPLGPNTLLLTGLRGHEALSQLFSFQLDLLAERSTEVSFDRLLGRPATVELVQGNGQKRYFHGIIKSFRQRLQDDVFTHYQAELTPRFWLWTKRVRSRVFQHKSVPDILKIVLDGLDVSFAHLNGHYPTRNYCVQYRESDFAFASRLMEDDGIYYYFEHTANGHKMILADNSSRSPDLPHQATLVFDQGEGGIRPEQRIDRWDKSQELCAGKYALWDDHFELPGQYLAAEQAIHTQATAGKVSHKLRVGGNDQLEIFDYPGGYSHRFDGINASGGEQQTELQKVFEDNQRTVRLRMEEEAASGLWVEGGGTYGQMTPGYKFRLRRHFNGDGAYVLSRVEHQAAIHGDYATGGDLTLVYSNQFHCLPLDLPYRPPRVTPRPVVRGPQTATVIGPAQASVSYTSQSNAAVGPTGDEIFCDRYGRVKVQFRWDRENKYSAESSCWIRVNQPWAGQQWGAITLPRVGQEVVVSFLEGDPDRPLILGSVYNAAQMPPFPLPAAKTQAGIKAHSQGKGANSQTFSGLGFETLVGQEHMHLHAERYMTHSAEKNLYVNAGEEHHVNVGRAASRQVGGLPLVNHALTHGKATQANSSPLLPLSPSSSPPPSPPSGGPHDWQTEINGYLGHDFNLTLGWSQANVVGLLSKPTLGQVITSNLHPAVVAEFIRPNMMTAQTDGVTKSIVRTFLTLANATVTMGNALTFQFGTTLNVGSGERLENRYTNWEQSPGTRKLAGLYAALTLTDAILPPLLPVEIKPKLGNMGITAARALAQELVLDIWAGIESVTAWKKKLEKDQKASADEEKISRYQDYTGALLFWQQRAAEDLKKLEREIKATKQKAEKTAAALIKQCDERYLIYAPEIGLHSEPNNNISHSSIMIGAYGEAGKSGHVSISASYETHVNGGNFAYLNLVTPTPDPEKQAGEITLDCGAKGTLTLQSGLEKKPNFLVMNQMGILVRSSKQVLLAVEKTKHLVKTDQILLQVGNSSIKVTDSGITLTCGGANSVKIASDGVSITGAKTSMNATTSCNIESPQTRVK